MKTLVIRTVIITIACIVAVAAIAYILTATVFPGAMADVYGNLGAYEKAAAYKTRAYESGGRIEDLAAASEYAVKSGDDKLIVSTVEKLIEDEAFAFYRAENGGRVGFLTARYVVAGYAVSGAEDALIDKAFSLLIGYGTHNEVESLIVAAYDKGDKDALIKIKSRLEDIDVGSLSEADKKVLDNDKALIEEGIK